MPRSALLLYVALAALAGSACGGEPVASDEGEMVEGASSEAYAKWIAFAESKGVRRERGRMLAIGIRGRDTAGNVHETRVVRAYDDTLVLLTGDEQAIVLPMSTHPWETSSAHVPDANGDGKGDVGMIRPGRYAPQARDASLNIAGAKTFHVLTTTGSERIPGYRNTDQDDLYSTAERDSSTTRKDYLTAVLFHQGGDGAPAAVGCQVLDPEGIRTLAQRAGAKFDYLLVDAANEPDLPLP